MRSAPAQPPELPEPYTLPGRRRRLLPPGLGRFLVFFVALSWVLLGLTVPYQLAETSAFRSRGVVAPTPAHVDDVVRHTSWRTHSTSYQIVVTYTTLDGATLTTNLRNWYQPVRPARGDLLPVRYLPDKPTKVEPAAFGDTYSAAWLSGVLGVIGTLYLTLRGVTRWRARNPSGR
jgi:hypothetical protein